MVAKGVSFVPLPRGGWDLVHQINCDLLQREAIVIGISHTDVEWNGHVEALG